LKTKLSKKRAISTVLTTVIILVASVALAAGVVLYGTSLFQSGTQIEAIIISHPKIWVHSTASEGLAWGAVGIRNSGDVVNSVDRIVIRGSDVPFSQWYADTTLSATTFQLALNHTGWSGTAGRLVDDTTCSPDSGILQIGLNSDKDDAGSICAAIAATGPIGLAPGANVVIYFQLTNGTLTILDSGLSTTLGIYAGKAGSPLNVVIQPIN